MNVSAKQRSALPSLSLIHYLGFTQAYARFEVHEVALGSWTVEDVISDTIITRGCWNQKEVTSLVLYKGGCPPSKTLRVPVPLVCSICTSCLCGSNEQHKEQLQQTGALKESHVSSPRPDAGFWDLGISHSITWKRFRADTGCPSSYEYQGSQKWKMKWKLIFPLQQPKGCRGGGRLCLQFWSAELSSDQNRARHSPSKLPFLLPYLPTVRSEQIGWHVQMTNDGDN